MRGHVIRHNYLHHINGFEGRGCRGVYLDDMFCGTTIHGNVFYKVPRAAFIGGGRDCTVENNVFVDCTPALHIDARGMGWAAGERERAHRAAPPVSVPGRALEQRATRASSTSSRTSPWCPRATWSRGTSRGREAGTRSKRGRVRTWCSRTTSWAWTRSSWTRRAWTSRCARIPGVRTRLQARSYGRHRAVLGRAQGLAARQARGAAGRSRRGQGKDLVAAARDAKEGTTCQWKDCARGSGSWAPWCASSASRPSPASRHRPAWTSSCSTWSTGLSPCRPSRTSRDWRGRSASAASSGCRSSRRATSRACSTLAPTGSWFRW